MKALPWFHMHTEARTDRKLATLTDREHRLWFNLLCFAAEQDERGVIPPTEDYLLSIEIGCHDCDELDALLRRLELLRMVSRDVTPSHADNESVTLGHITFIHFEDRNYDKPSDRPEATRERKARQREKERDIEHESRDVTPSHGVDKSREDKKRVEERNGAHAPTENMSKSPPPIYSDDFLTFWQQYPTGHGSKKLAFDAWRKLKPNAALQADMLAGLAKWNACDQWQRGFVTHAERFLKNRMWEDEPPIGTVVPQSKNANGFGPKGPDADWFANKARELERQGL